MTRFAQGKKWDPTALADELGGVPLFSVLEQKHLCELTRRFRPRHFGAGQPVFLQGDPGEEMYLVLDGRIRISCESTSGKEVTLATFTGGAFFGEMALLDGMPRSASAYAETRCEALLLRRTDFMDFLDRSPASARKLLAFLSRRLREANDKIQDLALLTVRQRLAAVLADLALREGEPEGTGILLGKSINHRVLAAMLGTSRESVSRMAAELRERGLIEQRGRRVLVKDVEGLRAEVEQAL